MVSFTGRLLVAITPMPSRDAFVKSVMKHQYEPYVVRGEVEQELETLFNNLDDFVTMCINCDGRRSYPSSHIVHEAHDPKKEILARQAVAATIDLILYVLSIECLYLQSAYPTTMGVAFAVRSDQIQSNKPVQDYIVAYMNPVTGAFTVAPPGFYLKTSREPDDVYEMGFTRLETDDVYEGEMIRELYEGHVNGSVRPLRPGRTTQELASMTRVLGYEPKTRPVPETARVRLPDFVSERKPKRDEDMEFEVDDEYSPDYGI